MGGTGALVRGLVGLLAARDVPVHCNAEVERIVVEGGRARGVELAGGERIDADIVVSNADTAWTYRHLVAPEHRRHWSDRAARPHALFDEPVRLVLRHVAPLRATCRTTRWCSGPRYEGLLRRHLQAGTTWRTTSASTCTGRPRPTLRWRRRAATAFYALSPVPHLDSGTDWASAAERYRQRIAARLERTLLPGLGRTSLDVSRVTTPHALPRRAAVVQGRGASASSRGCCRAPGSGRTTAARTCAGLYLVGAGTPPRRRRAGRADVGQGAGDACCPGWSASLRTRRGAGLGMARHGMTDDAGEHPGRLPRADARRLEVLLRGVARAAAARAPRRRRRCTPSAASPTTRSTPRAAAVARAARDCTSGSMPSTPAQPRPGGGRPGARRGGGTTRPAAPAARGAARRLRLGRRGPPLRDARGPARLRRARGRHGRRDDGGADGDARRGNAGARRASWAWRCS